MPVRAAMRLGVRFNRKTTKVWVANSNATVIGGKVVPVPSSAGANAWVDTGASGAQSVSLTITAGGDTGNAIFHLRVRANGSLNSEFYELYYDAGAGLAQIRRATIAGGNVTISSNGFPTVLAPGASRTLTLSIDASGNLTASDGGAMTPLTVTDNTVVHTYVGFVVGASTTGAANAGDTFVSGSITDNFNRFADNTLLNGQSTLT